MITADTIASHRRKILVFAVSAAALLVVIVIIVNGIMSPKEQYSLYGPHQKGITTPQQKEIMIVSFDVTTGTKQKLRGLLSDWTHAAEALLAGRPVGKVPLPDSVPPGDTGEALGLKPAKLTLLFGAGQTLFDDRFGLKEKRPPGFIDLPSFPNDRLEPEYGGGDLVVLAEGDDRQVLFHAVRTLARIAQGKAVLRWVQNGFYAPPGPNANSSVGRNLQGFHDGTANPDVNNPAVMNKVVWVQAADGAPWLTGGSYLVVRRIRMFIEVWDRSTLIDQEMTIGRDKLSGAPLSGKSQFEALDTKRKGTDGQPLIPADSHVALAHGFGDQQILRRGFSYVDGLDHRTSQWNAGLLFLSFQRDLLSQFVTIQSRFANDRLNEYIAAVGSAVFACFPGIRPGEIIGQKLFS